MEPCYHQPCHATSPPVTSFEMHLLFEGGADRRLYGGNLEKRFRKWGGKLLCVLILHGNTEYAVLTEAIQTVRIISGKETERVLQS